MLQKGNAQQQRLASSEKALSEQEEQDLVELDEDAIFELADQMAEWEADAGRCRECSKGCVVDGNCYKAHPKTGQNATEHLCRAHNGTWCAATPTCATCQDGCLAFGQCYTQTPWGSAATEQICQRYGGSWCGAPAPPAPTCTTCKGGCIARNKCFLKTPWGTKATEQVCMYHGGKWCGPKVTCATCNDGCIVYGKCYQLETGMSPEQGIAKCKQHNGTLCSSS